MCVVVCGGVWWVCGGVWWCVVVWWCVWYESLRSRRVCPGACLRATNWVAEHLGASSRRPRHPFPALMAGVNPGRVPVYTALPANPESSTGTLTTRRVMQLRNLYGLPDRLDHEKRTLRHDGEVNLHDQHNRDIGYRVLQLRMSMVKRTVWTMVSASAPRKRCRNCPSGPKRP